VEVSAPRPTIIIDECLPRTQFRTFFEGRGYTVYTVGEAFPSGSPDSVVLAAAELRAAIVVSSDTDWRTLLSSVRGQKGVVGRAGRILFNCDHSIALARLEEFIDDIEREYALAQRTGRRLIMRITGGNYTVER